MENTQQPKLELAKKVLPKPLFKAIQYIFNQGISDCALVGGTALSGFYAGHRKSDDIDLFVKTEFAFRAAVLACKSLEDDGATFSNLSQSQQFFHANCEYEKHFFTVDVVLDKHLFEIGNFFKLNAITVIDLETLLKMKAATLVSRCSEKDLYDLKWLMTEFKDLTVKNLISLGSLVDKGVHAENMLVSIAGTQLRESACDFSLSSKITKKIIFNEITKLQKELKLSLIQFLKAEPTPPIGVLLKKVKKGIR